MLSNLFLSRYLLLRKKLNKPDVFRPELGLLCDQDDIQLSKIWVCAVSLKLEVGDFINLMKCLLKPHIQPRKLVLYS